MGSEWRGRQQSYGQRRNWQRQIQAKKDKRYIGSFTDTERFNWDTVAEVYKRSDGNLDREGIVVRGDGAPFIRGFREYHLPKSRYILDYYLFFLIRRWKNVCQRFMRIKGSEGKNRKQS